jgi:hypothetical protein
VDEIPVTRHDDAASRVLETACRSAFNNWHLIWAFRGFVDALAPYADGILKGRNARFLRELMYGGQWHIADLQGLIDSGLPERFPGEAAQETKKKAYTALHAATAIFAHSIIDDVVLGCCKAGWLTHRERWTPLVNDRQLRVERLLKEPWEDLINKQLEGRLRSEPVPRRAKLLLDRYGSMLSAVSETMKDYTFDADRLQRFTELRNSIVHDGVFPTTDLTDDLEYIYKTGNVLLQTTALSCRIPLDFRKCLGAVSATTLNKPSAAEPR